jgi:oligoendopeptidase F
VELCIPHFPRLLRLPVRHLVHGLICAAEKVKAGDPRRSSYLAFPSAGGLKYPVDLPKDAGVDMTTDEPPDLTSLMNRIKDDMEKILAEKNR